MKTTKDLIHWLRQAADELEERLECGELRDNLNISCNTYGLELPFLATYDGFISLKYPTAEIDD